MCEEYTEKLSESDVTFKWNTMHLLSDLSPVNSSKLRASALIGIKPRRCASISSAIIESLLWIFACSMAIVGTYWVMSLSQGTSEIQIRLIAFANDVSASVRSNSN